MLKIDFKKYQANTNQKKNKVAVSWKTDLKAKHFYKQRSLR